MITNPKDFFQQVQNLVEEVALKIKAISSSLSSYLTKADAEATYLGKTEASNTYLGKSETATRATVADSATSADKATNDANGNNISNTYLKSTTAASTYLKQTDAQSKYLGKTAKAESAKTADTATSATSAGTATKAIQDGDGNVISGTYLKSTTAQSTYLSKTDASSTYLGKTAKAESAKTADSATKATQDGNGKNIATTYATIASLNTTNTNVATAQTTADAKVAISGNRGVLAGHAEPTTINYSSSIDGSSGDDMRYTGQEPNMVSVANGQVDETWVKTISFETDTASVALGSSWRWSNGEAPVIKSKSVLVLYWNGTFGIAHLMEGA